MDTTLDLFQETVTKYISPTAQVVRIEPQNSDDLYQFWSVAQLKRYAVHLDNGEVVSLIVKTMILKERNVLVYLSQQQQPAIPFTHTLDLTTDDFVPACTLDVANNSDPDENFTRQVAQGLAKIHFDNLGKVAEMPWLPKADPAYFQKFLVPEVWRGHWIKALENPTFAREFEKYTPLVEAAGEEFVRDMTELWEEGTTLTATHGEIHPTHVKCHNNKPYFVDWGWTYYGSFYLDLPAYFTPDNVLLYREEMAKLGLEIPETEFLKRFQQAGRYAAFKYLCAGIWNWPPGPTEETGRMLLIHLKRAQEGLWAESGFNISEERWQQLLAEHRAFLAHN